MQHLQFLDIADSDFWNWGFNGLHTVKSIYDFVNLKKIEVRVGNLFGL